MFSSIKNIGANDSPPHPLDFIAHEKLGDVWALLYSGMASQGSGGRSLLAYQPALEIAGGEFQSLEKPSAGQWFGYASYEMLHELEDVPITSNGPLSLPRQFWFQPSEVKLWNHQDASFPRRRESHDFLYGGDAVAIASRSTTPAARALASTSQPKVNTLTSNMTTAHYLSIVRDTIERIHAGDFYQANITRKFYGEFEDAPNPIALFQQLCAISPSPFSALLKLGDTWILSSSPEGFLQITEDGRVITRPIKGSAKPDDATLLDSTKDRAENLMIVDLMRNDLARSCVPESIRVESLYDIHRFATIQQMISTVTGKRRAECSVLDVIRGCFPPGSMTGAPKVAAMRWCAAQEQIQRGIYSGALGWINTEHQTADLSVVIRTLILQGNRFEFQVGGGIVADSVAEKELEESILKARAICKVLGIEAGALRQL